MTRDLAQRLQAGFVATYGNDPAIVARAPGRVNLIGEHTDYNDGFALPLAIGAETRVAIRPRAGGPIRVAALDYAEHDSFDLSSEFRRVGGWRDYVRGTLSVLHRAGVPLRGMDVAIAGDVPKGTGLSSSASLEVAVATAVIALAGQEHDPRQVALWAQAAENDFVGMRCGNLDQLASAATVAGNALLIDCRTLNLVPVPLPPDAFVMIVQSGVVRGLVEGEYNARRVQCEAATAALGVTALRDVDMATLEMARDNMDDVVYRRARHVVADNLRTLAAADALRANDIALLGELLRASHASQRDDFAITVPATCRLAALMNDTLGADGGARQTGGGFGGAVVALMHASAVSRVTERVKRSYRTPDGSVPDVRIERACAGASIVMRSC